MTIFQSTPLANDGNFGNVNRMMIEHDLRLYLLQVANQYAGATDAALSTVARRCRNDSSFFKRIADPSQSFTVKTFDEVIAWFRDNWPADREMPVLSLAGTGRGRPRAAREEAGTHG
ncbi:hypothetical protein GGC47_001068 [Bosea sp. OAE752]|uniref:hypothetical protein n=1 Tax=Bosea sp. OAE752 TaxID=2663873 RepID=UPI003D1D2238